MASGTRALDDVNGRGPARSGGASPDSGRRLALLIANESYSTDMRPLSNPVNDVNLIAGSLRGIGFADDDITVVRNVDRVDLLEAIDRHAQRVARAGKGAIGFLYYSGHGAANRADRRNYLIPVDVKKLDGRIWYNSVSLDDVVERLKNRADKAAHFVVFDACRDFLKTKSVGGSKGFVAMRERQGMLIAFSTNLGETATDVGDGSGPYAAALAAEIVKPGLDHLDLFQNVKERVRQRTQGQQPWTRDGLVRRVYFNGRLTRAQALAADAREAWPSFKDSTDPVVLEAFGRRFKGTVFADAALAKAKSLRAQPQPPPRRATRAAAGDREVVRRTRASRPVKPPSRQSEISYFLRPLRRDVLG